MEETIGQVLENLKVISKSSKTPQGQSQRQEKSSSNIRCTKTREEAIKECIENCPGPERCPSNGFILHDSGLENYGDVYSTCAYFREYSDRMKKIETLKRIFPRGLWTRTLESFQPHDKSTEKALELSGKYVEQRAWRIGASLVFLGGYGTGKTHLAAGILIEAARMGEDVAFSTASSLRMGSFNQIDGLFAEIKGKDLLVIDDFSNETENRTTNHRIFELLNHRYEDERGTIITSNLGIEDFSQTVGARIFDRLTERALIVELEGTQSYRERKRASYLGWTRV